MLIALTEKLFVSPQISVDMVAEAAQRGVSLIVNNRPEGEAPDQTPGDAIETAARAADMAYAAIPVTHAGFAPWQLDAFDEVMERNGEGKALLYCRSGTRSTLLWALSRARAGDDLGMIASTAAAAGYDVAPIAQIMEALAAGKGAAG